MRTKPGRKISLRLLLIILVFNAKISLYFCTKQALELKVIHLGIGYFSLPILVHGKADHVYSCEWNPVAVEALHKNIILNKCQNRCTVLEGDNRKVK